MMDMHLQFRIVETVKTLIIYIYISSIWFSLMSLEEHPQLILFFWKSSLTGPCSERDFQNQGIWIEWCPEWPKRSYNFTYSAVNEPYLSWISIIIHYYPSLSIIIHDYPWLSIIIHDLLAILSASFSFQSENWWNWSGPLVEWLLQHYLKQMDQFEVRGWVVPQGNHRKTRGTWWNMET